MSKAVSCHLDAGHSFVIVAHLLQEIGGCPLRPPDGEFGDVLRLNAGNAEREHQQQAEKCDFLEHR
jgi:hypothetical protein